MPHATAIVYEQNDVGQARYLKTAIVKRVVVVQDTV